MWSAVTTAYWNRVIGTDQIHAVGAARGCPCHHVTSLGRYMLPLEPTQ
jgi:hypothetical protein